MAWDRVLHKRLRDICAYLWEDARDCRRLVADAVIESGKIVFDEPPMLRWQSVIMECEKQGTLPKLCSVLLAEYPENTKLLEAISPWMPNISGGPPDQAKEPPPPAAPPPAPPPVATIAPVLPISIVPQPSEEFDELVVTIESMRADMAHLMQQVEELRRWRREIATVAAKDNSGGNETEIPMEISLPASKPKQPKAEN